MRLISKESLFYKVVFCLVLAYIVSVILSYDANWVNPEVVHRQIPGALKNGNRLVAGDFLRAFDVLSFEYGGSRVRFVSYLFQLLNIKFRIWLFDRIPPHPSLSITWIFSLILSPIFLFLMMYNLTASRTASWTCVILYCVSTGFLSGITELFHPGKPLANFFAVFCLYLASKVSPLVASGHGYSRKALLTYILLLVAIFISFFTDEKAWFIFICVPVLFPGIFRVGGKKALIISSYFSVVVGFLIFVTFLAPIITGHFGFKEFDFWRFSLKPHVSDKSRVWQEFKLSNIILNAHFLFSSSIIPVPPSAFIDDSPPKVIATSCGYLFFFLYLLYLFKKLPSDEKKIFLRSFYALLLFFLFQTILLTKYKRFIRFSFYYGALFPLFLAIPLSILLAIRKEPLKTFNKFVLIYLLIVFAVNFNKINRYFNYSHTYTGRFPKETEEMLPNAELTFSMAARAWARRSNKDELSKMKPQFPKRSYWLFRELEYTKENH